jgi:hypothetical protein
MAINPLKECNLSKNSSSIGTATRKKVLGRAEELAIINRSWLHNVSPSDFEKARRELTGDTDMAPQEATVKPFPQSER